MLPPQLLLSSSTTDVQKKMSIQPVNIQTHQDEGWRLYLQDDRNNIHIERCAVSSRTGHLVDTAVARSAFYKLILDTASKPRRWSWHK